MKRLAVVSSLAAAALAAPRPAAACGGYIAHSEGLRVNDALELVVVRDGTHTELSVRNRYRGPVEEFALLVPVPQVLHVEDVHTLDASVFDALAAITAPEVFYVREDDPCRPPSKGEEGSGAPGGGRGSDDGVRVEAAFQVGEYDVEVLSATDAAGLDAWLHAHAYQISDAMAPLLRPYVEGNSKFFVAKVDPARVKFVDGVATLSPLRFGYDADEVSLPLRLSTANSPGTQDVLVHTIAKTRLDAANRPNAQIPTGLWMRPGADFATFYEALFAATLAPHPDAVVTEYARSANDYRLQPLLAPLGVTAADPSTWVVTRLHLRPTRDGTKDDLVLREAAPIHGGIYDYQTPANDFVAAYRSGTPWTGEARCAKPVWGNWLPDPDGLDAHAGFGAPVPATAPRLAELIGQDLPALGVVAAYHAPERHRPHREARTGGGGGGGCCDATGAPGSTVTLVLLVLLALPSRRGPLRPRVRDDRARGV